MKKLFHVTVLISIFLLILSACGSAEEHTGEAKTPSGSDIMKGRAYEDVMEEFESNGFTNIKLEEIDDLITGLLTKEGEVEEVSVGGNVDYLADEWVSADTEVIIKYHVFPESDETQTVQNNGEQSDNNQNSTEGTAQNTVSSQDSDDVLTIKNCEALARILSLKSDHDDLYTDFAHEYKGMTIEFDGRIDYLTNHNDYKTRYDILVSAGDYDPDTQNGPTFKFEDVAAFDLNLQTLYLEDEISVGKNVRITAKVGTYNNDTGIFMLEPISIVAR